MAAMTPDPLACALFLTVAFIVAGLAHSAWLRMPVSRRLLIPLDGGLSFRGHRLFGENKTVRGFVVMVPAAAAAFAALHATISALAPEISASLWSLTWGEYAALGAWAGFGFMFGELPNSFVKRQLGVAPGMAPASRTGAIATFIVDRIDSILGMLIVVSLVAPTPWMTWVYVLLIGPGIHLAFSVLLHRLGVKARPV
jgi:CDP-2,3-bis-(O-geranylgeranyl)-sn-glycerol synthase